MTVKFYVYYIALSVFVRMVERKGTYINSLESNITEIPVHKIKDLNPLFYAIIDSRDNYYTTKQLKPYLDLSIIYNRYTYDAENLTSSG